MSEKIARLGIERANDLMYFIKNGDVWATPRKKPGQPKGKAQKIAEAGVELDYSKYIYFLDSDGDVARKARALGGGGRTKSKAKPSKTSSTRTSARSSISGHYVTEATAKRHPKATVEETVTRGTRGKKSEAQLDREIDECLAQMGKKKNGANGNGNGNRPAAAANGNGNGKRPAAAAPKKKRSKKKRGA